jgi:hypothetical protein
MKSMIILLLALTRASLNSCKRASGCRRPVRKSTTLRSIPRNPVWMLNDSIDFPVSSRIIPTMLRPIRLAWKPRLKSFTHHRWRWSCFWTTSSLTARRYCHSRQRIRADPSDRAKSSLFLSDVVYVYPCETTAFPSIFTYLRTDHQAGHVYSGEYGLRYRYVTCHS